VGQLLRFYKPKRPTSLTTKLDRAAFIPILDFHCFSLSSAVRDRRDGRGAINKT